MILMPRNPPFINNMIYHIICPEYYNQAYVKSITQATTLEGATEACIRKISLALALLSLLYRRWNSPW